MVFSHPIFRVSALAIALAAPVAAQEATLESVVATVGGTDITVAHVLDIKRQLPQQYQSIPDETLFTGIIDQLVRQTLLSQALETDPTWIEISMQNERRNLRSQIMLDRISAETATPEAMQALYAEKYLGEAAGQEYSAAHILVETEEKALELVDMLNGGADFGETAKANSTGPSGPRGGDLGWFGKGQMVPPFEQAVVSMEAGAISAPVQTQFGWHVIKLNEVRDVAPPAFEQVADELKTELTNAGIEAQLQVLESTGDIQRAEAGSISPSVLSTLSLTGAQ